MKITNLTALTLCVTTVAISSSCGASPVSTPVEKTSAISETTAEPQFQYSYPELDCNNEEFSILNASTTWGFYTNLDFDTLTGDVLDDAVFNRNRFIENQFNVKFSVTEEDVNKCHVKYRTSILAGDSEFDIAYCRSDAISSLVLEKYLYNLYDIPEFQLNEAWWDQMVVEQAIIGSNKQLYVANSDFNLYGFDATVCTFFNENMMSDLGIDLPYNLVKDGKWTLDIMNDYIKLGTNLNGDESFKWDAGNSATYGLTSWQTCVAGLLYGADQRYIDKDENNIPYLAIENDQFYTVAAKIGEMLGTEGQFLNINDSGENHYEMVFKAGRALFLIAQLKASSKYRDMKDSYGILPMPKYDENQKNYCCYRTGSAVIMSVPVTNTNPARTGIIMDALSYLRYRDVLPIYYNLNVSQKGLRNEESIEMLSIIRDTRYFDISRVFGWCDSLYNSIENSLLVGDSDLASKVESNKSSIETNIQKTIEILESNN